MDIGDDRAGRETYSNGAQGDGPNHMTSSAGGGLEKDNSDGRVDKGKGGIAGKDAGNRPAAILVVNVVSCEGSEATQHLRGTPDKHQLQLEIVCQSPKDIVLKDHEVGHVEKVGEKEGFMTRQEVDISFGGIVRKIRVFGKEVDVGGLEISHVAAARVEWFVFVLVLLL